jgi:hypothetical protein
MKWFELLKAPNMKDAQEVLDILVEFIEKHGQTIDLTQINELMDDTRDAEEYKENYMEDITGLDPAQIEYWGFAANFSNPFILAIREVIGLKDAISAISGNSAPGSAISAALQMRIGYYDFHKWIGNGEISKVKIIIDYIENKMRDELQEHGLEHYELEWD